MCNNPELLNANTCIAAVCPDRDRGIFLANVQAVSHILDILASLFVFLMNGLLIFFLCLSPPMPHRFL